MSLILDAINRADQERRESNHSPSLQTSQSPEPKAPRPYLRWAIEALIAIVVIGLIAYQWSINKADTQAKKTESRAVLQQHVEPTVDQQVRAAPQSGHADPARHNKKKTLNIQPVTASQAVTAPAPTTPLATAQKNDPASISALYSQTALAPKNDTRPATKTLTKTPVKEKTTAVSVITSNIPLLTDLPWRIQQQIPSIDFTQHNYSQFPNESTVELNRLLLKPGERVAAGLMLVSIDSEFITLNFQGTKFRLWALNSWVNFN